MKHLAECCEAGGSRFIHLSKMCIRDRLTAEDFNLRNRQSQEAVSERERYNIERMEKENINEVLRSCGGNITLAAEMLGITRTSLYRRIEKFKL